MEEVVNQHQTMGIGQVTDYSILNQGGLGKMVHGESYLTTPVEKESGRKSPEKKQQRTEGEEKVISKNFTLWGVASPKIESP